MSAPERPARLARPCPICGKPAVAAVRPFCSRRCADIDLNRWLSDAYVLPGLRDEEDADDAPASSGQRRGEPL